MPLLFLVHSCTATTGSRLGEALPALLVYLHCPGIKGSSMIDGMPSAYQALPEVIGELALSKK